MIAVDTNVLVYAHRREFAQHEPALDVLRELAEGSAPWGLPVFVLSEFLRITTHLRVLEPTSDEREAIAAIESVLASPTVRVLSPGESYWENLRRLVASGARGNLVHDAAIAAVCLEWGARTIVTEDQAFERFPGLAVRRLVG